MQTINTSIILNSFMQNKGDSVKVHLLIIPDESSPVQYAIRCNGSLRPLNRIVPGYMIPLMLVDEIPIRQANDHNAGCSNLNATINKSLVDQYYKNMEKLLYRLYFEPNLVFHMDTGRFDELIEGYTPVTVSGKSITGLVFTTPTSAIITSGNCI